MTLQDVSEAAAYVRAKAAAKPRIALILGSGLGELAQDVQEREEIPYADIPHWPASTAPGHAGRLILGRLETRPVVVMQGRVHLYEGYTAQQITLPVRVLHALGAEFLIITNAAGGVNPGFSPGTLMLVTDHINLTGHNPLTGPNASGERFPDMTAAYDPALRDLTLQVAQTLGVSLAEGVYLGLQGPSYETPAEIRMARTLGADAVGMSTVLEVIAARHAGMRVLGLSVITNKAAGLSPQPLSEQEVIEAANRVRGPFTTLIEGIVRGIAP